MKRKLLPFVLVGFLSGCGSILAIAGISGPGVQLINIVDTSKSIWDVNEYLEGNKTSTDYIVSKLVKRDCKIANILNNKSVCRVNWDDVVYTDNTGIED